MWEKGFKCNLVEWLISMTAVLSFCMFNCSEVFRWKAKWGWTWLWRVFKENMLNSSSKTMSRGKVAIRTEKQLLSSCHWLMHFTVVHSLRTLPSCFVLFYQKYLLCIDWVVTQIFMAVMHYYTGCRLEWWACVKAVWDMLWLLYLVYS